MRLSNIIEKLIITEKSIAKSDLPRYTFKVNKKASKGAIANAVKDLYQVDALEVRTMVMPGKRQRVRGANNQFKKTPNWKKAVVTLKEGQKIEYGDKNL